MQRESTAVEGECSLEGKPSRIGRCKRCEGRLRGAANRVNVRQQVTHIRRAARCSCWHFVRSFTSCCLCWCCGWRWCWCRKSSRQQTQTIELHHACISPQVARYYMLQQPTAHLHRIKAFSLVAFARQPSQTKQNIRARDHRVDISSGSGTLGDGATVGHNFRNQWI